MSLRGSAGSESNGPSKYLAPDLKPRWEVSEFSIENEIR